MVHRPHQPRLPLLASIACALGLALPLVAEDAPPAAPELPIPTAEAPGKKMPSFKLTLPGTIAVPVESAPPKALPPQKDPAFFGQGTKPVTISLGDAIQAALRNNLDARVEEVGVLIEEARLRNAYGEFDPVFSFSLSRSYAQTPDTRNNVSSADAVAQLEQIQAQINAINANTLANQDFTNSILRALGQPERTFDNSALLSANLSSNETIIFNQSLDRGEVAIQARSPIGTVLRAGVRTTRLVNSFDGDQRTLIPTYTANVTIEGRQPLLKDFGLDANLADIRIARKNRDQQELSWRFRLEATLQNVVATYYEMLFGMADLENKGEAINAGLRLVAHTQRRKELGFLSPYEVQQAQVQLAFDRENLLLSKNLFLDRQFALQRLMLDKYETGERRIYLPVAMPILKVPKLDRSALLAMAYENRADFKAAMMVAETEDIRIKFAKNQRLPQLDIVGSYGWTGLDRGYNDAFGQMTRSQAPAWQLGVTGSFPIGGIQPRAQVDAALARKQQAVLRIRATELQIGTNIDLAMELIHSSQQRLEAARFTTKTAEEAVRVGFRRMEEGFITNFDLIEQQRRLYDARTRELSATAELNKAITQLWLATGTVLENLGITYADDDPKKAKVAPAVPVAPAAKDTASKKPAVAQPKKKR